MKHSPITEATPISHAGPLPSEADVVIIGGGVIGVSTAIYLAQQGVRPVLIEKGRIAANNPRETGAGYANRAATPLNCPSWLRR